MGALGGFGGLFDPKAAGYVDPILVASTDGVGTKLKIAIETGKHDTVGIDLVAMCVNDLIVQGAEPLFFLDYFATAHLDPPTAAEVINGIAIGCLEAGCALLGGETAEMPGMYAKADYDLAGFSIGAAERDALLPRKDIRAGDVILALGSSGLHSNGFSLIRHILSNMQIHLSHNAPFNNSITWGEFLLTPTRIYVNSCLEIHKLGLVKAFAHITGGGLTDNIPRILPEGRAADLNLLSWSLPPVFKWLIEEGGVSPVEMARTFNCGVGMIIIVDENNAESAVQLLTKSGETVLQIGHITNQTGDVRVGMPNLNEVWSR